MNGNMLQASTFWANDAGWAIAPLAYLDQVAPLWYRWLQNEGQSGEEPIQAFKDLVDLKSSKWEYVPGSSEWNKIGAQVDKIENDNLFIIPIVKDMRSINIFPENIRNSPQDDNHMDTTFAAVQYWIEE